MQRREGRVRVLLSETRISLPEPIPAEPYVPVRQIVDEAGESPAGSAYVEVREPGINLHGRVGQLGENVPVQHWSKRNRGNASRRLPAFEIRVGDEEVIRVPDG